MIETFRYPVLTISRLGVVADADSLDWSGDANALTIADRDELKRGDHQGMLVIDSDLRCWKAASVSDKGPLGDSFWSRLVKSFLGIRRIDLQMVELEPMTLGQLHDRLEQAIRSAPYLWYDEELAAGEAGPPIPEEDQVAEAIAKFRATVSIPDVIELIDPGGLTYFEERKRGKQGG